MTRGLFSEEHDAFRDTVRRFIAAELVPHHAAWEEAQMVPRDVWRRAGEVGLLCPSVPAEYGGAGGDWLFDVVVIEELSRAGVTGPGAGFMVHSEMVAPYILAWGTPALKERWLPLMARGEAIGALGITEPGAGSDVKAISTRAVRRGDTYVIDGHKTYISNGQNCDLLVTACKTDPASGAHGVSLIVVDTSLPGFNRGRNLKKIGLRAQDTSELFLTGVETPVENRLGGEGGGFSMLMSKLAQERLTQAVRSVAAAEAAIEWTIAYTRERRAFGVVIADFQNTQFTLAQLGAEISALRVYTDWCVRRFLAEELTGVDAAKAKLLATDLHCKTVDQCLQFFGGNGYMQEFPIARAYMDARITRIAGGATEVMKQIISRDLMARGSVAASR